MEIRNFFQKCKLLLIVVLIGGLLNSCDRAKQTAKDAINKTGEIAGKGATEFIGGVKQGVDQTLACSVSLSDSLKSKGVKFGKFTVADSSGASNNLFTIYLIFDRDFTGTINVKIIDEKGMEYGRTKQEITAKQGEAKYVDFLFDARTHIESRSIIEMN